MDGPSKTEGRDCIFQIYFDFIQNIVLQCFFVRSTTLWKTGHALQGFCCHEHSSLGFLGLTVLKAV